ncbi:hypothetical protein PCANC_21610 [Puccinia coronata f. sp. avenae]|uniref:Integrase catalytic domain-containing protein n=1 Tax=Puccinia coronata f. sp. avenae TaxID=200324 RepID=A0A2N5SD64_9BASI|nr:hypothetical protein PCANC_21610 [Puccinia coronata f. sp. avenae]
MKYKSDSFKCFKLFRASFEKSGKHSIQSLRTNNGGEYLSNEFSVYLSSSGIKHEPGPPHSPELNGVAERTNRTISNLIPCALLQAGVPKSFWADALRHVFYSYNSVPCKTPSGFKSPASILNQPPVDPKYLHPFGCLAWYKVLEANRKKLDQKARSSMLLSYFLDGNANLPWDDAPPIQQLLGQPPPSGPTVPSPQTNPVCPRLSTLDQPLLNISLQPQFNQRLQASTHAPANQPPTVPSVPQPTPEPKPTVISIIELPPLPPSPPPQGSDGAVAPSGIAPTPSSPNTAQAPPSPPR